MSTARARMPRTMTLMRVARSRRRSRARAAEKGRDLGRGLEDVVDLAAGVGLGRLLGIFDGAGLADHIDLNDAWVGHGGFDLVGDVASEFEGGEVVDLLGLDNDADFAASGDSVGLVDAWEAGGDVLEVTHALGEVLSGNVAGAWASGGKRVDDFDDDGLGGGGLDVVVMGGHGVDDGVGHTVFLGELGADFGVLAFDFVGDGLTDVVEQGGGLGDAFVGADFVSDHTGDVGHFDGMEQDVLAVAGAEFEFAEEVEQFTRDADDADFAGGVFAGADDFFLDFAFGLSDGFFDGSGVDATVFHEALEGVAGDLAANGVEAREDDHTWGVINEDIDAGGALEGLDVATFLADNAALHVVVGELQCGNGAVSGNFGGHALHSGEQNGLSGFVDVVTEFFLFFDDEVGEVLFDVALGHLHELVASGFLGEAGDFFELGLLTIADVADFGFEVVKLLFLLGETLGFLFELVEFVVEVGLALVEAGFGALPFATALGFLLLRLGGEVGSGVFGLKDDIGGFVLGAAHKVVGFGFAAVFVFLVVCQNATCTGAHT